MLGSFGTSKAKTPANAAGHEHRHQHTKAAVEGCLTCWLFVAVTLSAALSQDAEKMAIDAGYTDLKRAHSERSIVVLGERVQFKNYYIVKMLDQYFTLVQDAPQKGEYELKEDRKSKTIIIH